MENLLVFMLLAFANSVIGDGCCKIKVVGGSTYTFTGEEDTSTFSCVDKCTYAKEGLENSKYCFAVGSMQVECKVAGSDEAGSTGSNEVPETTAGAVGGAETTIGADEPAVSFSGGSVPTLTTTPMPTISEEEILANLLSNDSRILNADGFGSLPQQVYIETKGLTCTGTMITDSIAITAGHCVPDSSYSNDDIKVYRPQGKCNGQGFIRGCNVKKRYKGQHNLCKLHGHDIALIRLERSMSGMKTLTLNYHPNFNYGTAMAGTGRNNWGDTCHSLYSYQKKIDCHEVGCYGEQWYCTRGYNRYTSGGCQGDSGGPSWAINRNGGAGLAGLTSNGPRKPCTNDWTAYVNLADYQDWIEEKMKTMKQCAVGGAETTIGADETADSFSGGSDDTINEDALAAYRLGLSSGDSEIIIRLAADSFNFTWVPESMVMNRDEYVQFLGKFKEEAEKDGRPKFSMRFNNLIQRKVDNTIFEAGDWIVDDFDRGVYMHAAQAGRIILDMATNSYDADAFNEDALAAYRLGLTTGDSETIIRMATDSFNFTWVPESMVMNREEYVQFLGKFKEEAEKEGRPKFSMRFDYLIQRKVGDTIVEAGDWIVDGYDRGVYMHAAQAGNITWDMATNY